LTVVRLGRNYAEVADTISGFMRRRFIIKTVINRMIVLLPLYKPSGTFMTPQIIAGSVNDRFSLAPKNLMGLWPRFGSDLVDKN